MVSIIKPWFYAMVVGVTYYYVSGFFWGYVAHDLWHIEWLYNLLREQRISSWTFRAVIHPHDILVNLLLAFPFAYLLSLIKPERKWWYVALAVIPLGLYQYRIVILENTADFFLVGGVAAIIGALTAFGSLPIAMCLVTALKARKGV